jgi:hypothetical protein
MSTTCIIQQIFTEQHSAAITLQTGILAMLGSNLGLYTAY